jgi:DNA-binding CsgD family transcriptional regulator
MRDTADVLSSEHAQIIVFAPDGRIEHEVSTEPDAARQYIDEYASRDPAAPLVAAAKHGTVIWSQTLMTPAELARCPVQNELLPSIDARSRSWILTQMEDGRGFGTAVFHARSHPGLDQRQSHRLRTLHSHVQQAMALHLTIETVRDKQRSLEVGLDALANGVVLVGHDGIVVFANLAARSHFASGRLRLLSGRLSGPTPSDDAAIRRLLATALGRGSHPGPTTTAVRDLRIEAVPAGESAFTQDSRVAVVLLIQETAPPMLTPGHLRPLGLTPAEGALAIALAQGETLDGYAARTGRSLGTVRVQLRTLFSKTDTHRQSELLLLVRRVAGLG